ncbi:RNA-dependent RNA polymerase [Tataguine virus]|uniref:RNA-directed RNA polymerase L n=2 Tax=Tataguine virus TaxID=1623310 RepID=A0A0R7FN83_9VIRU|nr:RNA-dependent RNA polymerase [Tataguine virus]AKO90164.1 RNA-dependent RNA polymerase [Tataguine virus]
MDPNQKNTFLARINGCRTADLAKDIDIDLLMERHNYFGRQLCQSLNIEYRDDVPLVDILAEMYPDVNLLWLDIPNITPDNYLIINEDFVYIIDYKVTVSMDTVRVTMEKYTKALNTVKDQIPQFNFEVVIIQANPVSYQIYVTSDSFRARYPDLNVQLDFNDFFELKTILYNKFEEDEEFLLKIAHGDFTLTSPWLSEKTPELKDHPIFIEFLDSMPKEYQESFIESLEYCSYTSERWNTLLYKIKEKTSTDYNAFLKNHANYLFCSEGEYPRPTRNEILEGWEIMSRRVEETREIMDSEVCQKPSIHFLWAEHDPTQSNDTVKKLIRLSGELQSISGANPMKTAFQQLGVCMDFKEEEGVYILHTERLKNEARKSYKPIDYKSIQNRRIGRSFVRWEQQFVLDTDNIGPLERKRLLKDFAGIGAHKVFKDRTLEDCDLQKPKILDFNKESIYIASLSMMNQFKHTLSKQSKVKRKNDLYDFYESSIKDASTLTNETVKKVMNSKYWDYVSDLSMLIKNMLSMSQYNKHNTFRVAMCANNSLYGILLPAADIKTKRSTIVFFFVALHKQEDECLSAGTLFAKFKTPTGYLSVSKAIRLDKERCQRLVISPGLFLLSTILLYNNNPNLDLNDVLNFCLFTSCSITKSMLSLTEPARYMMMNSLALSSNVKEYISEKFNPYTKTLFSVYMTRLIKKACLVAQSQRRKITVRDIHLTDYDITQKGVSSERDLEGIWFPGQVSIKEYINQIYLPFYFNAKGLHEKHHVMIDLVKTVGEIELEQRKTLNKIWSDTPEKQTVNLPVFLHSLSKMLINDTSRHNHLRDKIESRNNFRRSPTTVSTFTSSKSSVKIGDFTSIKSKLAKKNKNSIAAAERLYKIANPLLFEEAKANLETKHADYDMLKEAIPDFIDYMTTKNFDRLFELIDTGVVGNQSVIELSMSLMKTHRHLKFAMFNKGQKTYKDREIFEPQWETKLCMYPIERIAKERCKLNTDEMISEPGDNKLKILEGKSESEIRFLINNLKEKNKQVAETGELYQATKVEINADMSKWSAQDVFYKYFWLIALDPILYPQEKERILFFMCNYMQKELIIPDEVMCCLLDQKGPRHDDIMMILTEQLTSNHFTVKRNWLQGNFNYISSYVHSVAMSVYKDIVKSAIARIEGICLINSLVHSDDNQTSITIVQDKLNEDCIVDFCRRTFEVVCLTFGCQANMKKTYITNFVKEFVSLFNLYGEPYSVYGRFLLTSVGDCAYLGPYEDLANRISAAQTAIKHGCPPSYAWVSIYLSHWVTFQTYNMLPGQGNDPTSYLRMERSLIPPELCGILKADLSTIALVGLEADNLTFLTNILKKMSPILLKKEPVLNQLEHIEEWDLSKLSDSEIFRLKLIRYLVLDTEADSTDSMGETSDMRTRSLLTPRKFTTASSLNRLESFRKYQEVMSDNTKTERLLDFVLERPELLVTKGETSEEFYNMVLFRYNSKKFKESLSIQNPAQLFIEQILFSNKPVIDYNFIRERFLTLNDSLAAEENQIIVGRMTFKQTFAAIRSDIDTLTISHKDISIIYSFMISNDPLMLTVANSLVMSTIGSPQDRKALTSNSMPEFRNLKLIHYSPALVLKAFTKSTVDLPGVNQDELSRDLHHLKEFVNNTKLLEKYDARLTLQSFNNSLEEKMFRIRELTKMYQICYEYIKTSEHKIRIFILPSKCRTSYDFCSIIQGNLISDTKWFTVHYLKQINSGGYKGVMQKTTPSDLIISSECFRLLSFFADTFIAEFKRIEFLEYIINYFSYKTIPVSQLLFVMRNSQNRTDYLPILYHLGLLEQRDLDQYDAMKSSERISWNYRQTSRDFNTGPIDLTLKGYNREMLILGQDDILKIAELKLKSRTIDSILRAGSKLLNCRHGLRFEKMKQCDIEEGKLYITYQRKTHHQYTYQIHTFNSIKVRNSETPRLGRVKNDIIPVCEVIVSEYFDAPSISLRQLKYLNTDNIWLSKLKLNDNEVASIRRAPLEKMRLFEGPELTMGLLNITHLMKTTELLCLDYNKLISTNIISTAKLVDCNGESNDILEEDIMILSDEPLEQSVPESMNTTPAFNVHITKTGDSHMTYRNAIKILISRETERFKRSFDFTGDGFLSRTNLGVLAVLKFLINQLKTNEWSSILLSTIHLTMIVNNMDAEFHLLELPSYFFTNPIENKIDWQKLQNYIRTIPTTSDPLWKEIFENFKVKSQTLIQEKIDISTDFNQITSSIAMPFGRSDFEFTE